jgi:large subunit ribosomal protein L18
MSKKVMEKTRRRTRAHQRLRQRVAGSAAQPRLSVFKSLRYVYAQVIDDAAGRTVAQANSLETVIRAELGAGSGSKAAARKVGEVVAERALAQGVKRVVFDRGGYIYHGKVKEVADGARAKGLEF